MSGDTGPSGGDRPVRGAPTRDFVGHGPTPPTVRWPGDAFVALSVVVNYEEGSERSFADGDGCNEGLGEIGRHVDSDVRDLATESVYEYGSRAGVHRLTRLLDAYEAPATFFAAAVALERNPPLAAVLRESPHEVCAHGYRWSEVWRIGREEERALIDAAVASITETCGRRPVGWYNRWMPSVHTRELLVEEGGFSYDSNAYNDDLPYWVEVGGRGHLVVPYTLTYNDNRYVSGATGSPAAFVDAATRGLDYLWQEGAEGAPRMMSLGLHARWSGQAGRASAVREILDHARRLGHVWIATRRDIAGVWTDQHPWPGGGRRGPGPARPRPG